MHIILANILSSIKVYKLEAIELYTYIVNNNPYAINSAKKLIKLKNEMITLNISELWYNKLLEAYYYSIQQMFKKTLPIYTSLFSSHSTSNVIFTNMANCYLKIRT